MSWFFCYKGQTNSKNFKFDEVHDNANYVFDTGKFYVATGGPNLTNNYIFDEKRHSGWIVCGIGINCSQSAYKLMDTNDWNNLLLNDSPSFDSINGHYAILRFDRNKIELFTDKLGLREIFLSKYENNIFCTSRLEWISLYIKSEIDINIFSSRWLLFNQLSQGSLLIGIHRIVAGDSAVIHYHKISLNKVNTAYTENDLLAEEDFKSELNKLIQVGNLSNKKLSLSLSGGLDSRVILSFLLKGEFENWDTHTFGDPKSPDGVVVDRIIKKLRINHRSYHSSLIEIDELVNLISNYAIETQMTNPISTALQMRYYNSIEDKDVIIIDGGFGEIWRREFFNRLLLFGKKSLIKKNYKEILPHLLLFKADIFTNSLMDVMIQNCLNQIEEMFELLPNINKIGYENWLDLFAINTRLVNYYGIEQSRIDNIVCNYMPFAQHNILKLLLGMDTNIRKNGKLFRKIIRENYFQLAKFPLAKNDIIYPYIFNSIPSRVYSIIKKKLNMSYTDVNRKFLLESLSEFIMDTFHSSATKDFEFYDLMKLDNLLVKFREGDESVYAQIDWLCSFELYRRHLLRKYSNV